MNLKVLLRLYSLLLKELSCDLFSLNIIMLDFFSDLQRGLGKRGCLQEMTVHAEVFGCYCHGRILSVHPVVLCG